VVRAPEAVSVVRILLLTQWFDPEPTFKGLAFARALAARGHRVEVLTGFPNYPGGKVYDGYRIRWRQREHVEGIPVTRVALYPSHDSSSIRRLSNYATFAMSAATVGVFSVRRPDVVYACHPPGTIGLPAIVLRLLRGCPFVYDVLDLWPDSVATSGMMSSPRLNALLGRWCALVYRRAAQIVVPSPGLKRALVERGVPQEKIDVIYNWCDEANIAAAQGDEAAAIRFGMSGRFNVVFAGNMGKVQALDAVLEAAALLALRLPRVQFVFVGTGVEVSRLSQKAQDMGLQNVRFLPRQPIDEIGRILTLADVLLVHLKDDPLFRITIPSKTQAYMAVGRPILMAVKGDAAELIGQAKCGLSCEPQDPSSLAAVVETLAVKGREELRSLGEAGRQFYRDELSLNVGVSRFERVFHAAARSPYR
jgi:colanic acid biosynthesis glycosyl transferase WcaI